MRRAFEGKHHSAAVLVGRGGDGATRRLVAAATLIWALNEMFDLLTARVKKIDRSHIQFCLSK
jgi:hypothetical protein